MSNKSNLIIFESNRGFSNKIREYFQGKGIATHVVTKLPDIAEQIKQLAAPIVLVELPDPKAVSQKLVQSIIEHSDLFDYPLIVIGKDAIGHESYLNDYFKLATALRKPVANSDLLEAVKYISDVFVFPAEKRADDRPGTQIPAERQTKEDEKPADSAQDAGAAQQRDTGPELPENIPAHELYSAFHSIPEMFFEQSSAAAILSRDFNGCEYSLTNNKDKISDKSYLPKDQKALEIIEQMGSRLPRWGEARVHRVAALIHSIIKVICKDEALIEKSKSAAFLYNWTLALETKNLLRKDYLTSRSRILRKDVCSRVKDSAVKIAIDLGWSDTGNIVAAAARYIGREEKVANDNSALVASAIAAADMVDRACWHSNYFNPRSAYKLMTMAKSGDLRDFHPAVLCCMIKILSEAIASGTQYLMIPKKLRDNQALIEAAKKTREQTVSDNEQKIDIKQLAPGMRLSRPLIAFDGREILEEDMILDQDLIWRIWQLSLVRPLNAPLVVARKSEEAGTADSASESKPEEETAGTAAAAEPV